eukprot:COSAG01_NODE_4_length_55812_cov_1344.168109_15_plen_227_part_00
MAEDTGVEGFKNLQDYFRVDYVKNEAELLESQVSISPFQQFSEWFKLYVLSKPDVPNAMTLSTVSADLQARSRIVLMSEFDEKGFVFYSDYNSAKGDDLRNNPNACLQFFFANQERLVRIQGLVKKISRERSELYFRSRPRASQLSAFVSNQSHAVKSRSVMDALYRASDKNFLDQDIPMPDDWGGYCLSPNYFEFWQGRPNRFHDRLVYRLSRDKQSWQIDRLFP